MLVLDYIKIGVAAAALAGSFFAGKAWESDARDADLLVEATVAQENFVKENKRANGLAKDLARTKNELQAIKSAADRNFSKAMGDSRVDCLTDDGLRIVNEVLSGKPGSIGTERDAEVPSTDPAGR